MSFEDLGAIPPTVALRRSYSQFLGILGGHRSISVPPTPCRSWAVAIPSTLSPIVPTLPQPLVVRSDRLVLPNTWETGLGGPEIKIISIEVPGHNGAVPALLRRLAELGLKGRGKGVPANAGLVGTGEWPTPALVFAILHAEFKFTLDAAATAANAKCPLFFTREDDGLSRDWGRHVVFLNPPYDRGPRGLRRWMRKAAMAARLGATVVCLVPASTGSSWWHDWVLPCASEVRQVRGRLKFGDRTGPSKFSSAIVVYRPGSRKEKMPRFSVVSFPSSKRSASREAACKIPGPTVRKSAPDSKRVSTKVGELEAKIEAARQRLHCGKKKGRSRGGGYSKKQRETFGLPPGVSEDDLP